MKNIFDLKNKIKIMPAFLAHFYSLKLTNEKKVKADSQVKKSRKDFNKGFRKGMKVSFSLYSIFLLIKYTATPVHAADVPEFNTCPEPEAVVPVVRPGMQPLNEVVKGAFVGGSTTVCAAFFQSGDFLIGLACAILVVTGAIVINKPPPK
jgi:hypothetical protein